jgi:YgiT-type zinc finger domain-containing protein
MKRAEVRSTSTARGTISVEAARAWVCGQCGEPYFEEREVRAIQRLLLQLDKQAASLAPVA